MDGANRTRVQAFQSTSITPLDREICAFALRFTMVRPYQVAAWTGAAPKTVEARLRALHAGGYLSRAVTTADLLDHTGAIRQTVTHVWEATRRGADLAGPRTVPGTTAAVSLNPARPAALMANHVLGVADLACWYRQYGFEVAAEREIVSLEVPSKLTPQRPVVAAWTVPVVGRPGVHPPDLGAVGPDGRMWAVELERAVKTVQDYADVIRAYQGVGMGQVWHVLTQATARRLQEACTRAGVAWGPSPERGVLVSTDGAVRLQGWLPGRSGMTRPATWRHQVPITPPAGLAVGPRPDLGATWRRGRVVDVDAVAS